MRKCSKCKAYKADNEFNLKNKILGIKQKSCKLCTRIQIRSHYQNNREYYLIKAKLRNRKNKEVIKKFIWDYLLEHPCVDCGENDPIVLDFDHQKGKIASVSDLIQNKVSINKIVNEINKCLVRCANCHRRKTALDFNWYRKK